MFLKERHTKVFREFPGYPYVYALNFKPIEGHFFPAFCAHISGKMPFWPWARGRRHFVYRSLTSYAQSVPEGGREAGFSHCLLLLFFFSFFLLLFSSVFCQAKPGQSVPYPTRQKKSLQKTLILSCTKYSELGKFFTKNARCEISNTVGFSFSSSSPFLTPKQHPSFALLLSPSPLSPSHTTGGRRIRQRIPIKENLCTKKYLKFVKSYIFSQTPPPPGRGGYNGRGKKGGGK